MKSSFFIARKFISDRKKSRFFSFISLITIIGITLGVIALNLSLAILEGFEKTIENKIADFNSHIQVFAYNDRTIKNYEQVKITIEEKIQNEYLLISPYFQKNCILKHKNSSEGIVLKGIVEEKAIQIIKNEIIAGDANFDSKNSIVIGEKLAYKLGVKVGDTILAFGFKSQNQNFFNFKTFFDNLRISKFAISGIFRSGMEEYDNIYAFSSLKGAQSFFGFEDEATGFDIKLKNPARADELSYVLTSTLGYPLFARSIFETYSHIFNWIDLQRKPIPIMLGLITLVAAINIIGTLLMLSLEKSKQLGILMSIGAQPSLIKKVFVLQGIYLAAIGILWGTFISLLLCYLQLEFKIIKLPGSVYYLSEAPIAINFFNFALVAFCAIALSYLFSIIPATIASKRKPSEILRFE